MTSKARRVVKGITIVGHNGTVTFFHDRTLVGGIKSGNTPLFPEPGFHVSLLLSNIRFDKEGNPVKDCFNKFRHRSKDTHKVFNVKKEAIDYAIKVLHELNPAKEIS